MGSKADRDLKEVTPMVEKIKAVFPALASLSNDELRAKTADFKARIDAHISAELSSIEELKAKVEQTADINQKEDLYAEIDKIEGSIDGKIEEVLLEILPEAFAVVKETARRFTENESIEVTASEMDRNLAAERDSIEVNGDKATWATTWNAAGAEIKWDMIHYDVQLIGGITLTPEKLLRWRLEKEKH